MDEIRKLVEASGSYSKWALRQRKAFIELRLRQDLELRAIYIEWVNQIAKEIEEAQALGISAAYLEDIENHLRRYVEYLDLLLTEAFNKHFVIAVSSGSYIHEKILIEAIDKSRIKKITKKQVKGAIFRVNERSVQAMWNRHKHGLFLSERIWKTSEKAADNIGRIITEAISEGKHPTEIAKMLQGYVRDGKGTLVTNYPNMMRRIGSLPQDLSYEALRLARTETAAAHTDGMISSASMNPGYKGVKWLLSPSHPVRDICDHYAEQDIHGLGPGVYRKGQEPLFPPHPNCLCSLVAEMEDIDSLINRLLEWERDPSSHPDIEELFQRELNQVA